MNVITGTLYVVATPIGNLKDITIRALEILDSVSVIASEDTRNTAKLLKHYEISTKMISFHDHNEKSRTPELISRLVHGDSVALVTDAGTPLVSDPGYPLVHAAVNKSIPVVPVPGPSAVPASLCASGLPSDAFYFSGFLPRKAGKRKQRIREMAQLSATLIVYVPASRLIPTLEELYDGMGERYAVICREMTKVHEEFIRGMLSELIVQLGRKNSILGECTLVIAGKTENEVLSSVEIEEIIKERLLANPDGIAAISKEIAEIYCLSRKVVYQKALLLVKTNANLTKK